MNIIEASAKLVSPPVYRDVLERIERAGRVCYKSESKSQFTVESGEKFVKSIIERGHESVLEHVSLGAIIICDRGVSHELVRHRLASYSQENTRYCNYSKDDFHGELTVIKPCFWYKTDKQYRIWEEACEYAEMLYMKLIEAGATAQEARTLLPNSTKTEIAMTANIREWRHFFKLRCDKASHPQMREIACMLRDVCQDRYPALFNLI
jgi:thymidylate synthase (FAD)